MIVKSPPARRAFWEAWRAPPAGRGSWWRGVLSALLARRNRLGGGLSELRLRPLFVPIATRRHRAFARLVRPREIGALCSSGSLSQAADLGQFLRGVRSWARCWDRDPSGHVRSGVG